MKINLLPKREIKRAVYKTINVFSLIALLLNMSMVGVFIHPQAASAITYTHKLSITKTDSQDPVYAGLTTTYTLKVTNTGTASEYNIVGTDTLPAQLTYVSGDTGVSAIGQAVTINFGGLGASDNRSKTFVVRASSAITTDTSVTNNVSVVSDSGANATSSQTTTIKPIVRNGLSNACGLPLDVELIIDRSGSMVDGPGGEPLATVKTSSKSFVDQLAADTDYTHRAGLTSYSTTARLDQSMTSNFTAVKNKITALTSDSWTNIGEGVRVGQQDILDTPRPGSELSQKIIVLFTDGVANRYGSGATACAEWPATSTECTNQAIAQANTAKTNDTVIYTIGYFSGLVSPEAIAAKPLAQDVLRAMASETSNFYEAATPADIQTIFNEIRADLCPPNLEFHKAAVNQTHPGATTIANPARPDDIIQYTLTVNNTGTGPAKNFVITDDLSDILEFANFVDASDSGTLVANSITYPSRTINAGATVNVTFRVKIKQYASWPANPQNFTISNVYGDQIDIPLLRTGTLKVIKQVSGSTEPSSSWQIHVKQGSAEVAGSPQPGSATGTEYMLMPGSYQVTETGGPANYGLTYSASCTGGDATVTAGQTTTCTLTNTRQTGSLKVTKYVDSGTATPSQWNFTIDGYGTKTPTVGQNYVIFNNLPTGSYSVSESALTDYHQVSSTCTNVSVGAGQQATCNFHNAHDTGNLTVIKKLDSNGDGQIESTNPAGWTWDIDSGNQNYAFGSTQNVLTGTHSITEDQHTDYHAVSWTCTDGTSGTGETIRANVTTADLTCTFTNARDTGTLTVIKHVVGGAAQASDWTMHVKQNTTEVVSFTGTENPGTTKTLVTGTYQVTESNGPVGYTLAYSGDCDASGNLTLTTGGHKTCTLTNTRDTGSITVNKFVQNADGSTVYNPADWTWSLNSESGIAAGATKTILTLNNYTVTESTSVYPSGNYATTWVCYAGDVIYSQGTGTSFDVQIDTKGQHLNCTFTNVRQTTQVTFDKQLVGGEHDGSDWSFTIPGIPGSYTEDSAPVTVPTNATYIITESSAYNNLYTLTGASGICSLEDGKIVMHTGEEGGVCIVQNTRLTGSIIVHKNVVAPDGTTDVSDGHTFTVKLDGSNQKSINESATATYANLPTGPYTINEEADADYTFVKFTDLQGHTLNMPITVNPAAATDVVVVNKQKPATITINKDVLNYLGNPATDDTEFTVEWSGGIPYPVKESWPITLLVDPGTYTFHEVANANYTTPVDMFEITVGSNGSAERTFINWQKSASISGYKWNDLNGDGIWQQNEPALDDWTICLYPGTPNLLTFGPTSSLASAIPCVVTGSGDWPTGYYEFTNLVPGYYTLSEYLPDGWLQTHEPSSVTLSPATNSQNNNFGNFQNGIIAGYKFNNDHQPLNGWEICLSGGEISDSVDTDFGVHCVTTGDESYDWPDGYYEFNGLPFGDYIVSETLQPGWQQIAPGDDGKYHVTINSGTGCGEEPTMYNFINRRLYPDLSVTKTDGLTVANPGQTLTYQLVFKNTGEYKAENVVVTDMLPAHLTFISADPLPTSQTDSVITWQLGTMEPGAEIHATLTVAVESIMPFGTTELTNAVRITTTSTEPNTENNNATDTDTVTAAPVLSLTKTAPAQVNAGDTITYTINWSVAGTSTATDVMLTDPIPANTTFVSADQAGAYDAATKTVSWNIGTKNPGASGTVHLVVKTNSPLNNGTVITNTATLDAAEIDPVIAQATTTIVSGPTLSIDKATTQTTVTAGNDITFTINWSVGGNAVATGVTITDPLPANTTFVSTSNSGAYNPTTKVISWSLGTVNPGTTGAFTVVLKVATPLANGTTITNTATIDSDQTPPVSDSASTTVTAKPLLTITKVSDKSVVTAGEKVTYTVTIKNTGTDTATNVKLVDLLPAGFTFTEFGTSTHTWTLGNLAAGAELTVSYQVTVAATVKAGTYENLAVASSDNNGNVTTKVPVEVKVPTVLGEEAMPILRISKTLSKAFINPGNDVTYTVKITNNGDAPALNVQLQDVLPAGLTFEDKSITKLWKLGDIAVGASKTITYKALSDKTILPGTYENLAIAWADNHDKVSTSVKLDVRAVKVLGEALPTTGGSFLGYLYFALLGLAVMILVYVGKHRESEQL